MSSDKFWDRMEDINAGMLAVDGKTRFVPMSHNTDADERTLWFITAKGTDLVSAAEAGPVEATYLVAEGGKGLYARVEGRLSISNDRAKLDELWNLVASSWFDGGKDDPDLRLLAFNVADGEAWATPSGAGFLFQIAKAQLTGAQPDAGEHFRL
jgi:general stress protein 26